MILINGNWEQVNNLEDVIRVIGEYYNDELAKRMEGLLPKFSEDDYYDLCNECGDLEMEIESLESEVDDLKSEISRLEDKIEELEEQLNED